MATFKVGDRVAWSRKAVGMADQFPNLTVPMVVIGTFPAKYPVSHPQDIIIDGVSHPFNGVWFKKFRA